MIFDACINSLAVVFCGCQFAGISIELDISSGITNPIIHLNKLLLEKTRYYGIAFSVIKQIDIQIC